MAQGLFDKGNGAVVLGKLCVPLRNSSFISTPGQSPIPPSSGSAVLRSEQSEPPKLSTSLSSSPPSLVNIEITSPPSSKSTTKNPTEQHPFIFEHQAGVRDWEAPKMNPTEQLISYFEHQGLGKWAHQLQNCGHNVYLRCKNCGEHRPTPIHCGLRICPQCAEKRFKRLLGKYGKILSQNFRHRPKLLTLTIKNVEKLHSGVFSSLSKSFQLMRRRFPSMRGGLRSIEAVNHGRGWNVHLHILLDMPFTNQKKLSRIWKELTNSAVVDIRACNKNGVFEVLGYTMKNPTSGFEKLADYAEFLKATYHQRLTQSFGFPFGAFPILRAVCKCENCGGHEWEFDNQYSPPPPEALPPPTETEKRIEIIYAKGQLNL